MEIPLEDRRCWYRWTTSILIERLVFKKRLGIISVFENRLLFSYAYGKFIN